jgi:hypothetical protein
MIVSQRVGIRLASAVALLLLEGWMVARLKGEALDFDRSVVRWDAELATV